MRPFLWWALLALGAIAFGLHLAAHLQYRRHKLIPPPHSGGGMVSTVAIMFLIAAELIGLGRPVALVFLGGGIVFMGWSWAFVVRSFKRLRRARSPTSP